jgi:hypothetical protein
MTLPTTSAHRLVLKDYEAIINASKAFAANPQLAETTQIIIIEEEELQEELKKRMNKNKKRTKKSMTPREKTDFVPSQPF